MEDTIKPVSLGDMLEKGLEIEAFCNAYGCDHNTIIETAMIIEKLGANYEVPSVGKRMKGSKCHAKNVHTRPAWRIGDEWKDA